MPFKDIQSGDLVILDSQKNISLIDYFEYCDVPIIVLDVWRIWESVYFCYLYNNEVIHGKIYPNTIITTLAKMQDAV